MNTTGDQDRRDPAAAGSDGRASDEGPEPLGSGLSKGFVFLALFSGVLAVITLLPSAPPAEIADPESRICPVERGELAFSPEVVLFDGVFAPLPPEGAAEMERWIEIFREDFAETFRVYLGRARQWEDRVAPVLAREGVPEDFLYLAVIESGFNPRAISALHAVGVWQFRRYTAQHEGLRVAWDVDERRDPVAATEAAARHLRRLHSGFGDWTLATASYNAGPGRVLRARWNAGGDADFWELYRRRLLPSQTRSYIPKLLAAARVAHDPGGTGFGFVPMPEPAPPTRLVEVDPGSHLDVIASAAEIPPEQLRSLNPHLIRGRAPSSRPAHVRLPEAVVPDFRARFAEIPPRERRGGAVHVVSRSETLGQIARSYGMPVRALQAANPEVEPRRLRVGQRLQVPGGAQ